MENHLRSLDELSLKDTVLRRIAVILCSNPAVACFIANTNLTPVCKMERESAVQGMALELLSKFSLPASTLNELFNVMKPVCREIAKWLNFHEEFLKCPDPCLHGLPIEQYLCWTRVGTVDYRKTAKELICHEVLDVEKLYKLACLYCFEDCIRDLWIKVPLQSKESFYKARRPLLVRQPEIVVIWTYIIKGRVNELNSFFREDGRNFSSIYQYAFESVAVKGYKSAAEYFFQELTYEERLVSLKRTARAVINQRTFDDCTYAYEYQKFSDVLFYLLSRMSEKQRKELLRIRTCEILKCCLDWPRQDIFVDVAELAFPYLKGEGYSRLVFILSKNITSGCNYSEVLRKFFLISPKKLKDYARIRYGYCLREFFNAEDVETIKFIFRNLDAADRMGLALSDTGLTCCYDLILGNKWYLLELFVQEAIPSKEDRVKFMIAFVAKYALDLHADTCLRFVNWLTGINAGTSNQDCSKCDNATQVDFPPIEYFETHSDEELIDLSPIEHFQTHFDEDLINLSPIAFFETHPDEELIESLPIEHFETHPDEELIGSPPIDNFETHPDEDRLESPPIDNFETHPDEERTENPCKKLKKF